MFESLPTIQKYDKSVSEYERLKLYSVYLLNIQKKKRRKVFGVKFPPKNHEIDLKKKIQKLFKKNTRQKLDNKHPVESWS